MPTYPHICHECEHEWEEFYGIKDPVPTVCPECGTEGKIERLIAGGCGRGIVELSFQEKKEHIKESARKELREISKNEKALANMVGEKRYHENQLLRDRLKRGDY